MDMMSTALSEDVTMMKTLHALRRLGVIAVPFLTMFASSRSMSKTGSGGNEFFTTRKGLVPIASIEITSTSGGSLTGQLKGH